MIKVLFIIESLHCGGAEKSLLSLLSNLPEDKFEISLLLLNSGGVFETDIPPYVNVVRASNSYTLYSRFKYFFIKKFTMRKHHAAQSFWKSVSNDIESFDKKYDAAIAWGQGFATYYTAEKVSSPKKFAWINIDYDAAGYLWDADADKYAKFEKVVGVSEYVRLSLEKYLPSQKTTYIKNIIDVSKVTILAEEEPKFKFEDDTFNIVSIGRLAKQKNFKLAIRTAKLLADGGVNFHWYIIGDGEQRVELQSLINELKLERYVSLMGFIKNPYPYIKSCDLYCQTSEFEGLGRVLIEANHLNIPTVTTKFPSAYSLVEHGKTGLIVEHDSLSVSDAIISLYSDVNLMNEMINNISMVSFDTRTETVESFIDLLNDDN